MELSQQNDSLTFTSHKLAVDWAALHAASLPEEVSGYASGRLSISHCQRHIQQNVRTHESYCGPALRAWTIGYAFGISVCSTP